MKLGDYAITEAGFGADLGAEKFLDIKCREIKIHPDVVVCVATIKAIKYHGGVPKEDIQKQNIEAIDKGIHNLYKHIDNLSNIYGLNVLVALNKYNTDTEEEIEYLKNKIESKGYEFSVVEGWAKGGEGAIDIANKIVTLAENETKFKYVYELEEDIKSKIQDIAQKVYGAQDVKYSTEALESIKKIEDLGYKNLPVCIAKTQYSFSDDAKNLNCIEPFDISVRDVILKSGAGFIVVLAGKIMTMPGLPRVPAAENIDLDENEEVKGIF